MYIPQVLASLLTKSLSVLMEEEKTVVKVVIVGDHAVGKSSIVVKYTNGSFDISNSKPTVGAACIEKEFTHENADYILSMWDTAGQEAYRNLVPMYFRNTQIAIIVFDVTKIESLDSIEYWVNCVNENCGSDIIVVIVANKIDMTNDRKISTDEIQKISDQYKIPFFETSALTGVGISKLFEFTISEYFKKERAYKKNTIQPAKKTGGCGC